ncbi:hypothetical protein CONPUDRAFT_124586 [Coniophora puteana RWD-64-598 SS2]|uniref:Uncharacterized protein n=1 Tax=Coniophora puteana (strain RWD-64-598) TaxID=741705 RepID=A0A5M3MQW5_CONPW|nr:uncharacterized protein CONPUDRAFT_124586 [Coniophora puteana RWD-64-598 SS2]EIW81457.1 hypothetical protein CONPUDRAFT_124586 [Coniophora puteana RWD-64-598 SS2]
MNSPSIPTWTASNPPSPFPFSPSTLQVPPLELEQSSLALRAHSVSHTAGGPVVALQAVHERSLMLALSRSGELRLHDSLDGSLLANAVASQSQSSLPSPERWKWSRMTILDRQSKDSVCVVAIASAATEEDDEDEGLFSSSDSASESDSRSANFALFNVSFGSGTLKDSISCLGTCSLKLAEGEEGLDIRTVDVWADADGEPIIAILNESGHLVLRSLFAYTRRGGSIHSVASNGTKSSSPATSTSASATAAAIAASASSGLILPNPFRGNGAKSPEPGSSPSTNEVDEVRQVMLGKTRDVGSVLPEGCKVLRMGSRAVDAGRRVVGAVVHVKEDESLGVVGFECNSHDDSLRTHSLDVQSETPTSAWTSDAVAVDFVNDETLALTLGKEARYFKVEPHLRWSLSQTIPLDDVHTSVATESGILILRASTKDIVIHPREVAKPSRLWVSQAHREETLPSPEDAPRLTAALPLELGLIILGYSDGLLRQTSLPRMAIPAADSDTFVKMSDVPMNGAVQSIFVVQHDRTKERFVVGGADDGGLGVWSLDTLELRARWTPFMAPLVHVIQITQPGPLRGCAICVSKDGAAVVFAIDGLSFLYMVPTSSTPLTKLYLSGDNLLVLYASSMGRLWDMRTGEFWRALSSDKVRELVAQGEWTEFDVSEKVGPHTTSLSAFPTSNSSSPDLACTLVLDLERFIKSSPLHPRSGASTATVPTSTHDSLEHVRSVLAVLLTSGISPDIDDICLQRLGIQLSSGGVGLAGESASVLLNLPCSREAWCISPRVSAARALAVIACLRALGTNERLTDDCQTVITFYATSLGSTLGICFQPPDLVYLARTWFESSHDIRHAARILVDAGVVRMSDEESVMLCDRWQHHLPWLQPDAYKESELAALALFICGSIAVEKYSLLSAGALTDVAKSVTSYLYDEHSKHRLLAIDLAARGFHIWQHYVDAMDMLRALCSLATSHRKDTISAQNAGPMARSAVLQIASANTPLFMTTLTMDILSPKSAEHRKSVLQIVAFLIRKRPMVLYANLPKLMEAVVKSLDPNASSSRDVVFDTATEILGHVVKTFPTVDFHGATQRLAVGTSEGAFIMYDLKTSTQLYVLEGHKKRPTACSFSPDGRRLVTVSLEEGVVLVWKVGSSFTSLFNPGAPPRQGHSGSAPYKTLPFNVGNEADMSISGTLEWVRFEWVAERNVRLKIKESVLTFST